MAPGVDATTATGPAAPRTPPLRARPFEATRTWWLGPTSYAVPPPLQRLLFGRRLAPSRAEYAAALDAAWDGDAEADALVASMQGQDRALFERALAHGIAAVPEAPAPLRRFFASVEREPAWLDRAAIEDGARFLRESGLASLIVLRDGALMGGYLLTGFNHALIATGELGDATSTRLAGTARWWLDCTARGGLERGGPGYQSSLRVRLVHALVRRELSARADWDGARWGLPINQIDMAATYLAFSVATLMGLRMLGVFASAREARGVMHLFRYACWLMGVEERWLVDDERAGMVRLHHAVLTHGGPDWTTLKLARALEREPLGRPFPVAQGLWRRLEYEAHLSATSWFMGLGRMREIGLPARAPWFPLAAFVPLALARGSRRLPGLGRHHERLGRRLQEQAVRRVMGGAVGPAVHRGPCCPCPDGSGSR